MDSTSSLQSPVGHSVRPRFYRPELDVLRLIAFLMVFLYHTPSTLHFPLYAEIHTAGKFGVGIFFLLSAYLITELLLREHERSGTIRARAFFVRRALRIWPLMLAGLVLGVLVGNFVPAWRFTLLDARWFALFAGNIFNAQHLDIKNGAMVLWSISVEEQFYLFIPAIVLLFGRRGLMAVSSVAIVVAYIAIAYEVKTSPSPLYPIWFNSFVNFQFFAAGMVIAVVSHSKPWRISSVGRLGLVFLSFLGFVLAAFATFQHRHFPHDLLRYFMCYVAALGATIFLFLAMFGLDLSRQKIAIYLGKISFGLYVFHGFVMQALFYPATGRPFEPESTWSLARKFPGLCDVLALALTIGLASISYRYFEGPINRYKERFAVIKSGSEKLTV